MLSETKKKINGADKGKRAERDLCKLFAARFPGKPFERSVGSGNRWSQVKELTAAAKEVFSGDLTVPEGFLWCIESKCGYDAVDLGSLATNKTLDSMLAQAQGDAARAARLPLLAFRQARRPWVAFVPSEALEGLVGLPGHRLTYGDWTGVALEGLLQATSDGFWFGDTTITP